VIAQPPQIIERIETRTVLVLPEGASRRQIYQALGRADRILSLPAGQTQQ